MSEEFKFTTPEQARDISNMILELAVKAYMRGEISDEEKDGIITFNAQCMAFILAMDEQGMIRMDNKK